MSNITARIDDLIRQATTERSHYYTASVLRSAKAEIARLTAEVERLQEEIIGASRYQPMYNGRPSCPFCENFVDDEETHKPDCIVLTLGRIDAALKEAKERTSHD